MKLPKSFRIEKDLEEKTKQLIKESKINDSYDLFTDFSVEDMISKARIIVVKGDNKVYFRNTNYGYASRYSYSNEDYGLEIDIDHKTFASGHGIVFNLKIYSQGKKMLDCNESNVKAYTPGDWELNLVDIFKEEIAKNI
ncbi:MAG: hypothetical protein L6408_01175 [Nanoarchaeota archaeon]|nr:hypothetical protein [Nanoarchaeota archaeon]